MAKTGPFGPTLPINAPAYALGSGDPAALRRDCAPAGVGDVVPVGAQLNLTARGEIQPVTLANGQAGRCPLLLGRDHHAVAGRRREVAAAAGPHGARHR